MNARESVLSDKAREIRTLADYLERYPRDAHRRIHELMNLMYDYKRTCLNEDLGSDAVRLDENTILWTPGRVPADDCNPCDVLTFTPCDGCHSGVCEHMGTCMRKVDDPH